MIRRPVQQPNVRQDVRNVLQLQFVKDAIMRISYFKIFAISGNI
jgi:hypothetical protein